MGVRIGAAAFLAASLILAAAGARAAEITQAVRPFSVSGSGAVSQTLTFDAFAPALGTLREARLHFLEPTLQGALRVSIIGAGFLDVRGSLAVQAVVSGPDALPIIATGGMASAGCTTTELPACTSGVAELQPFASPALPATIAIADTARLAPFIGSGRVELTVGLAFVNADIGTCFDMLGLLLGTQPVCNVVLAQGGFSGGLGLTYLYSEPATAVPEPAGLALFGLGLAGAVAARRRRR